MRIAFKTLFIILLTASPALTQDSNIPRLEAYVMASQVESLFSSPASREKALQRFREIGITKIYLETHRSGRIPDENVLKSARDFLRRNGIEVSGGVTTTAGDKFGTPSNTGGLWINYQSGQTRRELSAHFRRIAACFDEIMIDDFLATDDNSEFSLNAKGDRTWPQYRMDLLSDFSRQFIIEPAREVNPGVQFIIKFPQWYDRFHLFGYDVVNAPQIFDRVWVGTETRNPDTVRYGYVMPTEGYINYSWLRSLAREKIGGAWYDFGDCTKDVYLMQAYQSVLAGAQELVLFEAGSLLQKNPCIDTFMERRNALFALGRIVQGKKALGMAAYKPPHSDGSDSRGSCNLYIYDYIAALGLAPIPVAQVPPNPKTVFLPRQAAADTKIADSIRRWLSQGITILVTPDFLAGLNDPAITEAAGFKHPLPLANETKSVVEYSQKNILAEPGSDGTKDITIPSDPNKDRIRIIPHPKSAVIKCSAITKDGEIPFLTEKKHERGGRILVLNVSTFSHDEFAPGKEQFLPPRPLPIKDWPKSLVSLIHWSVPYPYGIRINSPGNVGVYFFEGQLLVLANFNSEPVECSVFPPNGKSIALKLHKDFPHLQETEIMKISDSDGEYENSSVTVPAWELAVLQW